MYHSRCESRIFLLCIFLICQLVVVALYIWGGAPRNLNISPIRFKQHITQSHHTEHDSIMLPSQPVEDYFVLVNGSTCFRYGTDFSRMARGGKCECLPTHHGNDCSLPEVIWRAFIALRQNIVIRRRSGNQRRIVIVSDGVSATHQATQLNELRSIVDLFVVPTVHNQKFIKGMEEKVLVGNSWRSAVQNLEADDLILEVPAHVIPLPTALLFFKLFDGFPSPVRFRLKWNVYGYFFQHPNRTRLFPDGDAALTIGDLNHYGGWFCELCLDSLNATMQDVVADGLYSDKKTLLLQTHSSQPYFAPEYVMNNSWQFDSLVTNFYSQMDYN